MAEPLSLDIRKRIVCRVSRRTTAGRVAASESARIKLVERYERTGSLEPGQMGSHRPFALASHDALVRGLIAAHPDQTLDELLVRLIEREVVVRRTSVHRYLSAIGLTRQKRQSMPPSKTGRTSRPPEQRAAKTSQT